MMLILTTSFKAYLEEAGFFVDVYNNSVKALQNYKPHYYDLLLIDIRMPIINGFRLVKKLKEIDNSIKMFHNCF